MDGRIARLKEDKASLLRGAEGANDPRLPFLDDQLERAAKERERVLGRAADLYVADHAQKRMVLQRVLKEVATKTQELSTAAQVKQKVDEKNAEIRRNGVNKDAAIREREILEQRSVEERDAVRIESIACEPERPYTPDTSANMTIGLLIGALPLAFMLLRRAALAVWPGHRS